MFTSVEILPHSISYQVTEKNVFLMRGICAICFKQYCLSTVIQVYIFAYKYKISICEIEANEMSVIEQISQRAHEPNNKTISNQAVEYMAQTNTLLQQLFAASGTLWTQSQPLVFLMNYPNLLGQFKMQMGEYEYALTPEGKSVCQSMQLSLEKAVKLLFKQLHFITSNFNTFYHECSISETKTSGKISLVPLELVCPLAKISCWFHRLTLTFKKENINKMLFMLMIKKSITMVWRQP